MADNPEFPRNPVDMYPFSDIRNPRCQQWTQFAAAALAGGLAEPQGFSEQQNLVNQALELADAMMAAIAEREQERNDV